MTALLAILFLLMIAAPCIIALRSSPTNDEGQESEPEAAVEAEPAIVAEVHPIEQEIFEPAPRTGVMSLQQLADQAEREAIVAESRARRAYWAALDAAAHAAALRADAAAEVAELAGRAADRAIREAQAEFGERFLDEIHAAVEPIRSRGDRRAA